ncbi:MAG: hypothetical protein M1828_002130 [Chrysothrix sp. TS-e1954]|nr:MAG: hypothetical protein M1828_002130 [Chrysothrix sp. TS-e1954]
MIITLFNVFILCLSLGAATSIIPLTAQHGRQSKADDTPKQTPLLIWHGLGDAFDSDGMKSVAELYQEVYPNATVYSIAAADSGSSDRQASWLGKVNDQINKTCNDLLDHPILSNAAEVNALGFSQGGQFMRAFIERCNVPPVKNLITFGSQHNGISQFQKCSASDLLCRSWSGVLQNNAWSSFAQNRLVPAQYFRDPEDLESYLNYSSFLADVNNERTNRSASYKRNLASLDRFVMYMFDEDDVVRPRESSWFAEVNKTTGEVTSLRHREIYKEDWLGLKALDEKGGLKFKTAAGKHMQLDDRLLKSAFKSYFSTYAKADAEATSEESTIPLEVAEQQVL